MQLRLNIPQMRIEQTEPTPYPAVSACKTPGASRINKGLAFLYSARHALRKRRIDLKNNSMVPDDQIWQSSLNNLVQSTSGSLLYLQGTLWHAPSAYTSPSNVSSATWVVVMQRSALGKHFLQAFVVAYSLDDRNNGTSKRVLWLIPCPGQQIRMTRISTDLSAHDRTTPVRTSNTEYA